MNGRLNKWWVCGLVACVLGLFVLGGPASAQTSKAALCSDMTRVAEADAAVLLHPTEHRVRQLASDLKAAAAVVPPTTVAANRTQLTTLIATNLLSHNAPAIAATEAQYAEMWAQDAAGMFGYVSSSSSSVDAKLAPVARYVEQACPRSGDALTGLDTAHLRPRAGAGS